MFFQDSEAIQSIYQASGLRNALVSIYSAAKSVEHLLNLYSEGTDPTFNAVIDTLYNEQEKGELAAMLTTISLLIEDWEKNHRAAINLEPIEDPEGQGDLEGQEE